MWNQIGNSQVISLISQPVNLGYEIFDSGLTVAEVKSIFYHQFFVLVYGQEYLLEITKS